VRVAEPVGKPLMSLALKPKPTLPVAADAVAETRRTDAARTTDTSKVTFIFLSSNL
jgi:hypothetical protein